MIPRFVYQISKKKKKKRKIEKINCKNAGLASDKKLVIECQERSRACCWKLTAKIASVRATSLDALLAAPEISP